MQPESSLGNAATNRSSGFADEKAFVRRSFSAHRTLGALPPVRPTPARSLKAVLFQGAWKASF